MSPTLDGAYVLVPGASLPDGREPHARGRNGWFRPHRLAVELFAPGSVALAVESGREPPPGNRAPVYIELDAATARQFAMRILDITAQELHEVTITDGGRRCTTCDQLEEEHYAWVRTGPEEGWS